MIAPRTSEIRYTKAVRLPFVPAPSALIITGTDAPIAMPMIIGSASLNWIIPVMESACSIPTAALALWMTAVNSMPARMPINGLEKLVIIFMNTALSRRGITASDIIVMPYISTAKPSRMPAMFFNCFFFENILIPVPISATAPVIIAVFRYFAILAPVLLRLFKHSIQPVMLVPRIAPSMTPIACFTFMMPELTKPTVITDVADDDCITAVTPVPSSIPLNVLPDSL